MGKRLLIQVQGKSSLLLEESFRTSEVPRGGPKLCFSNCNLALFFLFCFVLFFLLRFTVV